MVCFLMFGGLVLLFEVKVYAIFLAKVHLASPKKGLRLASLEESCTLSLDRNRILCLSLNNYD